MAQGSAGGWVEPAGCTMLVNVNMESCTATQLASDARLLSRNINSKGHSHFLLFLISTQKFTAT